MRSVALPLNHIRRQKRTDASLLFVFAQLFKHVYGTGRKEYGTGRKYMEREIVGLKCSLACAYVLFYYMLTLSAHHMHTSLTHDLLSIEKSDKYLLN